MKWAEPAASASERALRRGLLGQAVLVGLLSILFLLQLIWRQEREGSWYVMLVLFIFYITLGSSHIIGDLRALSGWRRLPVMPGETLLWGTLAQLISPKGGAFQGTFALSTTRLRYQPRLLSRLRGAAEKEWPLDQLGAVRVTPVDARRKFRGGRWVELDVVDATTITILNAEQHLLADDLFEALRRARAVREADSVAGHIAPRPRGRDLSQ